MEPSLWDRELDGMYETPTTQLPAIFDSSPRSRVRNAFSIGIIGSVVALLALFVFLFRVFGPRDAVILSIVAGWPVVIAIGLWNRWAIVRIREFVYFLGLTSVGLVVIAGSISELYRSGADHEHAQELALERMIRELKTNPALYNVRLESRSKGYFFLSGVVQSRDDLGRLESIAARYSIDIATDQIQVIGEMKGPIYQKLR